MKTPSAADADSCCYCYIAIIMMSLILLLILSTPNKIENTSSSDPEYQAVLLAAQHHHHHHHQEKRGPCEEIYVVGEGETLETISDKCGDPFIVEHNPHIHDPDDVFPGLLIKITPHPYHHY